MHCSKLMCQSIFKFIDTKKLCLNNVKKCKINYTFNNLYFQVANKSTDSGLLGTVDIYNGVTVDATRSTFEPSDFEIKLSDSLKVWEEEQRRCIWFNISVKNSFCVPLLAKEGFHFHHASEDFLTMYKWLPTDCSPNLPPSCHTNMGVGAMVFNNKDELLAVSEHHYNYAHWKLPGGYINKGENIIPAAIREVKEETGVDCQFESLVTLRHTHNMMYGNSDVYILLRMSAQTEEITISNREIKECKWMDLNEYFNHPNIHYFNKFLVQTALEHKKKGFKLNLQRNLVRWPNTVRDTEILIVTDL